MILLATAAVSLVQRRDTTATLNLLSNITQFHDSSLTITTCTTQRSLYDIVWSSFATIFVCCWVSIHPNMPSWKDTDRFIVGRRLELLGWGLLAPELLVLWAMRQWYGARALANRYKGKFVAV